MDDGQKSKGRQADLQYIFQCRKCRWRDKSVEDHKKLHYGVEAVADDSCVGME